MRFYKFAFFIISIFSNFIPLIANIDENKLDQLVKQIEKCDSKKFIELCQNYNYQLTKDERRLLQINIIRLNRQINLAAQHVSNSHRLYEKVGPLAGASIFIPSLLTFFIGTLNDNNTMMLGSGIGILSSVPIYIFASVYTKLTFDRITKDCEKYHLDFNKIVGEFNSIQKHLNLCHIEYVK